MHTQQPITKAYFIKRLIALCLRSGLSGFPKSSLDQHILLKSAVLTLGEADGFTEKEINEKLIYWIEYVGHIKELDYSALRRWLIDAGYLTRSKDGAWYQKAPSGSQSQAFDETVDQIDVIAVIAAGQAEIMQRRKAYQEK